MSKRPNILFIIADDHRYSGIRAFGNMEVHTPVLDRLAESGVSFHNNHIMGGILPAVCVPCRTSIQTGASVFRSSIGSDIGDYNGNMHIRPQLPILPETMRDAGYYTHIVGKWHNDTQSLNRGFCSGATINFGPNDSQYELPVHNFDPTGEYPQATAYPCGKHSAELYSDRAVEFIRNYGKDGQPFLLYLGYNSPHDPRTAPPEYADMYDPERISLPPNFLPEHPFDNGELRIRDELLAPFPRTPEVIRQHIADYYAMISHLDAQIGRVLQALENNGEADNTLIVYTADHGLAVGQHGLMGKQNMYDHTVRVPLIVSGSGLPRNKRIQALSYTYDLFPTLCDLVGVAIPESVESASLVKLINGEETKVRESVYSLYQDTQRMVSDGRWKLIRYYHSEIRQGTVRIQLFDLANDPWEMQDLSPLTEHRGQIQRLARELTAWQQRVGDPLADRPRLPASWV